MLILPIPLYEFRPILQLEGFLMLNTCAFLRVVVWGVIANIPTLQCGALNVSGFQFDGVLKLQLYFLESCDVLRDFSLLRVPLDMTCPVDEMNFFYRCSSLPSETQKASGTLRGRIRILRIHSFHIPCSFDIEWRALFLFLFRVTVIPNVLPVVDVELLDSPRC